MEQQLKEKCKKISEKLNEMSFNEIQFVFKNLTEEQKSAFEQILFIQAYKNEFHTKSYNDCKKAVNKKIEKYYDSENCNPSLTLFEFVAYEISKEKNKKGVIRKEKLTTSNEFKKIKQIHKESEKLYDEFQKALNEGDISKAMEFRVKMCDNEKKEENLYNEMIKKKKEKNSNGK